ncbi:MAG: aldo/keto reductase [Aquisalimonadaceae bacterium]
MTCNGNPKFSTGGLSRRRLLGLMAGSGAALVTSGWPLGAAGNTGGEDAQEMILREIPGTGERLPAAGMGTYRSFDINRADTAAMDRMREVLRVFVDGGGRVVDSSPMYGKSEQVLGELAADLDATDRLWMATKVWTRGRAAGVRQMESSLELMGKTPLDLMQVHNLLDVDTHLETLREWKQRGVIRYIGITHYRAAMHDDMAKLLQRYPLDFAQFNFNLLDRDAERRLLPACADLGVATIINEPYAQGRLFRRIGERPLPGWADEIGCRSWAQIFLKYLIAHPAVTAVIPATGNPNHARDNVAAGRGPLPDADLRRRMVRALDE